MKTKMRSLMGFSGFRLAAEAALFSAVLGLGSSACGPAEYVKVDSIEDELAPGSYVIPPKVDILLAEDDTGSIIQAYDDIAEQMPAVLDRLEAAGWDYRFATTPLTTRRSINEIVVSKYDPNWGSLWQAPYPGATIDLMSGIGAEYFTAPEEYTEFVDEDDADSWLAGSEPGFSTIHNALSSRLSSAGFLREDALLMILVVGNGDDTSGVTYCTRSDDLTVPCEEVGRSGTYDSSFETYRELFAGLKGGDEAKIRFYAAVSEEEVSSCLGGRARRGERYIDMAAALNGEVVDICSQSVESAFGLVADSLEEQRLDYRTRYLFMDQEPDASTIQVVKYDDGSASAAVTLEQDAENGWTYVGYVENVYAIDYPVEMTLASGWAIELHGDARLLGTDSAKVTYLPAAGASSSAD